MDPKDIHPSDLAYKRITGFDQNRKPFDERTPEEHTANWARLFESLRIFLTKI